MTSFKSKDIKAALVKKGFHETQDSHHFLYVYYLDGRKTAIRTFVSHGSKDYSNALLGKMKNQLGLTKEQLHDLVKCPLTKEALYEIYHEKEE